MAPRYTSFLPVCLVCLLTAATARAQDPAQAGASALQGYNSTQWRLEFVSATHIRFTGEVELEPGPGLKVFADEINLHTDTQQFIATGNVVFTNPEGRISAERVEFNLGQQTGTFVEASGVLSLGATADRIQFGGQDPDVYFYGDRVEKIGPKKYRITRGGFTTCVQPTPRWELTSGSVVLNLDEYALLTNTVLRVKGVPLFYLPVAYYPIQEDQRSTGFLLPTYGTSSLRGQTISNGFFWAINRSHDATFFHDWYTRTGQGYGAEYRYIAGAQSDGNVRVYRLSQKESEFQTGGTTQRLPQTESFEVRASATQAVMRGLRARARVDYFSDVVSQQLYHQNLYDASRRSRVVSGALTGAWGKYSTSVNYDRNEIFFNETTSTVYGSTPRLAAAVAPTRLFGAPVYASVNGEFANLPFRSEDNAVLTRDQGLTRFDVAPLVRVPISRWTFLTLTTSAGYRLTHYSERLNDQGIQIPEPFTRSYFEVRTEAVGPVFTKIWDAAAESRAERYKHVIEPTFRYHQVTPIDDFRSTPILSNSADLVVGGAGTLTYGLTNRLLRRDRPREGASPGAREFLQISVQQTYYSNPEASQSDPTFASSVQGRSLVDLSPVALTVRYSPTPATSATMRMEHDVSGGGLQSLSAAGNVQLGPHSAGASLSRRRLVPTQPAETFLNGTGAVSFLQGRVTGRYAMNWDIARRFIVSQTLSATYFAQCCGVAVEFQNFNFPQVSSSFPIPADRRLNFSFTLAGLGTFSNFFGAFGGTAR